MQASSAPKRCSWNRSVIPFLVERQLHGRANSSLHPTRGHSLARRFRASVQRDALRRATGAQRPRAGEPRNVRPSGHALGMGMRENPMFSISTGSARENCDSLHTKPS